MIRCSNARHVIQGDEWYLLILELLKLTRFPARIKAKTLSSVMSGLFQTNANIEIILISRNLFPFSAVFRNKCRKNEGLFPKWGVFSEQTKRVSYPVAEQFGDGPPVQAKHPLNLTLRGVIVASHRLCQFYLGRIGEKRNPAVSILLFG